MGYELSRKRVERIMRKNEIRARRRRKYRVTTDSNHDFNVAKNKLRRNFSTEKKNAVWTGDITFIWTQQGWLYLAVILDLYSRRVVGWAMDEGIDRSLTLAALRMAFQRRKPQPGLIHHTDRGKQYACGEYQDLLSEYGSIPSMSRKGDCWDNAVTESFFSTLKKEFVGFEKFSTREEAKSAIFEWIEVFYNRQRRHSTNGYLSPASFEDAMSA
jgi:transposase InsO family protein